MSVRIGSGRFAGRELLGPHRERRGRNAPPGASGGGTRPTAARLKKSLFAVIGDELSGARVLDVCAGVGALGFEAMSLGAVRCVFVERSRRMGDRIEQNAARLGVEDARVIREEAARALARLARQGERFEVAFFDPPWSDWEEGRAARALAAIAPLVFHLVAAVHPASRPAPEEVLPAEIVVPPEAPLAQAALPELRFRRVREVSAGDGAFSLFRPVEPPSAIRNPPLTQIP